MKSAAWLGGWGIALVALSCDPGLSLEDALGGKRCGTTEPKCLGDYVCDEALQECVKPEDVRLPQRVPMNEAPPPANAGGAGGSEMTTGIVTMTSEVTAVGAVAAVADAGREPVTSEVADAGLDTMNPDLAAAPDAAASCVRPLFKDRDGDGYGSDAPGDQTVGCLSPGWVDRGGDCFDAEPTVPNSVLVHPGQLGFFPEGYSRPDRPGEISFDYDCSTREEPAPSNVVVPSADCNSAFPACEDGTGVLPVDRAGAGINALCGSRTVVLCEARNGTCLRQMTTAPLSRVFLCH